MSIQEEIHLAMSELQKKVDKSLELDLSDIELLFLTSLIEEEAQ